MAVKHTSAHWQEYVHFSVTFLGWMRMMMMMIGMMIGMMIQHRGDAGVNQAPCAINQYEPSKIALS